MTLNIRSVQNPPDADCCICWDRLQNGTAVVDHEKGGDRHPMHRACLVPWLQEHPVCPYCRSTLNPRSMLSRTRRIWDCSRNVLTGAVAGAASAWVSSWTLQRYDVRMSYLAAKTAVAGVAMLAQAIPDPFARGGAMLVDNALNEIGNLFTMGINMTIIKRVIQTTAKHWGDSSAMQLALLAADLIGALPISHLPTVSLIGGLVSGALAGFLSY
jgi:hypothetical protein